MKNTFLCTLLTAAPFLGMAAEVYGNAKTQVAITGAVTNVAIGVANRQSISVGSVQGKHARTGSFSSKYGKSGVLFNVGVNGVGYGSDGLSLGGKQDVNEDSVTD